MSDLASDFNEISFLIWAFREDWDCSSSKALSLRTVLDRTVDGAIEVRRRRDEENEEGVRWEAVKNWGWGECKLGF